MSKPKVARVQVDPPSIPLSDVTITCYRPSHFVGEEGPQAIAVTGRQLGQVLAWLARTRPGLIGNDPARDDMWTPDDVAMDLEGLGGILRGLGEVSLQEIPVDAGSMFCLLAEIANDLAARLSASAEGDRTLKRATIALPTRKAAAA
jgi:hypothetical protein